MAREGEWYENINYRSRRKRRFRRGRSVSPYHDIQLSDITSTETPFPYFQADVREIGALDQAMECVDVIIHTELGYRPQYNFGTFMNDFAKNGLDGV